MVETQTQSAPKSELASGVGHIVYFMDKALTPGDIAELRRLDPENPSSPAFWKLITSNKFEEILPEYGTAREQAETRWAVLMKVMALTKGLNQPKTRLGKVLAEKGYSELRFTRLLRSSQTELHNTIILLARYLNSKAAHFDVLDLAWLIFTDPGTDAGERTRRNLARDYYRNIDTH